jgi:hypothetical protein
MSTSTEYEFHARVLKVEERYTKTYDAEKVGNAKVEAQMEGEDVSTGWWVVLEGWSVAIRFGKLKPNIEKGQTMIIDMRVMP